MANTFHVSLNVKSIPEAVERYRKILGAEPAKLRSDYAKFELADPPLILSLNLGGTPGTVGHLGIRYPEPGQVAAGLAAGRPRRARPLPPGGSHLLLRQGRQVLGARRRRRAVGDVHAPRRRGGGAGAGSWAHEVPLAERWWRVLCSPMR